MRQRQRRRMARHLKQPKTVPSIITMAMDAPDFDFERWMARTDPLKYSAPAFTYLGRLTTLGNCAVYRAKPRQLNEYMWFAVPSTKCKATLFVLDNRPRKLASVWAIRWIRQQQPSQIQAAVAMALLLDKTVCLVRTFGPKPSENFHD